MNKKALENYRNKTTSQLRETFDGMTEAAFCNMWVNFDTKEWLDCAYAMLKVIEERQGWGEEDEA